jgi:hypothetical protein
MITLNVNRISMKGGNPDHDQRQNRLINFDIGFRRIRFVSCTVQLWRIDSHNKGPDRAKESTFCL